MLFRHAQDHYRALLRAATNDVELTELEAAAFGVSHDALGAALCESWGVHGGAVASVRHHVSAQATQTLPAKCLDRLEPWDLPELVPYGDEYLSGFVAESYQVNLEQGVNARTFQLGCTPVVNLFEQSAEPVALTQTRYEYRLVPSRETPLGTEVYSVDASRRTNGCQSRSR